MKVLAESDRLQGNRLAIFLQLGTNATGQFSGTLIAQTARKMRLDKNLNALPSCGPTRWRPSTRCSMPSAQSRAFRTPRPASCCPRTSCRTPVAPCKARALYGRKCLAATARSSPHATPATSAPATNPRCKPAALNKAELTASCFRAAARLAA